MKWFHTICFLIVQSSLIQGSTIRNINPLSDGCVKEQYINLATAGYDVSRSLKFSFDPQNPPSFRTLAIAEVSAAWSTFLSGYCSGIPQNAAWWAGQCRPDVSNLRDALCIFAAIYPPMDPNGQWKSFDPWYMVMENITHFGYHETGDYLDMYSVPNSTKERDESFNRILEWWHWYHDLLGSGAVNPILLPSGPTWDQYVRLTGNIMSDGSAISDINIDYTWRWMTRQFWGYTEYAKKYYHGFENIAYLMNTQQQTAMGMNDSNYLRVMSFTDLTDKSQDSWIEYQIHEEYHDLRKQLRAMFGTLKKYPQILPLAWYPMSLLEAPNIALWDIGSFLSAEIGGRKLYQVISQNNAETRSLLKAANWPDAVIDLAIAMCLGGYYGLAEGKCGYINGVDPPACPHIAEQGPWDFLSRFGYINDKFMRWKYKVEVKTSPSILEQERLEMMELLSQLKTWLANNDLRNLMHTMTTYLPNYLCLGETVPPTKFPTQSPTKLVPTSHPTLSPTRTGATRAPTIPTSPPTPSPTKKPTQSPTKNPTNPPTPAPTKARVFPHTSKLPIIILDTGGINLGISDSKHSMVYIYNGQDGQDTVYSPKNYRYGLEASVKERTKEIRQTTLKRFLGLSFKNPDDYLYILGMPTNEDWLLRAPFMDHTLIHDQFGDSISRSIGMYAPRTIAVELYIVDSVSPDSTESWQDVIEYNKHYQGVYILEERPKRGGNRIDVHKQKPLNEGDGEPPQDNGFILALNHLDENDERFALKHGGEAQIVYPGSPTLNETNWIIQWLNKMEDVLFKNSDMTWLNPKNGYRSMINVDSFIDYFILSELCASADAYLYNTYFYYDGGRGNKLHMGPLFMLELSFGNVEKIRGSTGGSNLISGWRYEERIKDRNGADISQWYGRLLSDPFFKERLLLRWNELSNDQLSKSNLQRLIGTLTYPLKTKSIESSAAERNFIKWPNSRAWDDTIQPAQPKSYETVIDELRSWIDGRHDWISANIMKVMFHTYTAEGTTCDIPGIVLKPNIVQNRAHGRSLLSSTCPGRQTDCPGTQSGDPQCQMRIDWLKNNLPNIPEIDGSICSIQMYIHNENPTRCPNPCLGDCAAVCQGPYPLYPDCQNHINYVINHMGDPSYAAGGVDGSVCSILSFLKKQPGIDACPNACNPSCETDDCIGPWGTDYPECYDHMYWLARNWYLTPANYPGVNGTTCSYQRFLSKEGHCPPVKCDSASHPVSHPVSHPISHPISHPTPAPVISPTSISVTPSPTSVGGGSIITTSSSCYGEKKVTTKLKCISGRCQDPQHILPVPPHIITTPNHSAGETVLLVIVMISIAVSIVYFTFRYNKKKKKADPLGEPMLAINN